MANSFFSGPSDVAVGATASSSSPGILDEIKQTAGGWLNEVMGRQAPSDHSQTPPQGQAQPHFGNFNPMAGQQPARNNRGQEQQHSHQGTNNGFDVSHQMQQFVLRLGLHPGAGINSGTSPFPNHEFHHSRQSQPNTGFAQGFNQRHVLAPGQASTPGNIFTPGNVFAPGQTSTPGNIFTPGHVFAPGQAHQQGGMGSYDAPVLHGDPTRRAPGYPGGLGFGGNQQEQTAANSGIYSQALYQIMLRAYHDRSNENILPSNLPLREVPPEVAGKVARWMLLTDSDMSQRFQQFGGRDLRPLPNPNPGHVYAVGLSSSGSPLDIVDYYCNNNQMTYYGQHVINYFKDNRGNVHTHVSDYMSSDQTHIAGPQRAIGDSRNVYTGASEYVSSAKGQPLAMVRYSQNDLRQPQIGFNFNNNGATMFWTDANSGQMRQQNLPGAQAEQAVKSQSQRFDFEHLFGP